MNKEFVTYIQAVALKELGFDEPCLSYYDREKLFKFPGTTMRNRNFSDLLTVTAPLYQQAFRWFREKYKLHHSIDYECSQHDHKWGYNWSIYNYNQVVKTDEEYITSHPDAPAGEWVYDSDEEAEQECLDKLIKLVKNDNT